jgi:hypothetical protein
MHSLLPAVGEEPGMGLLNKRRVSSGGSQNLEKP